MSYRRNSSRTMTTRPATIIIIIIIIIVIIIIIIIIITALYLGTANDWSYDTVRHILYVSKNITQ